MDAMKCLSFTRAVNVPVLGVIENMSGYVCPCCGEISNLFSSGGGEAMANREGLEFLGRLPVDSELVTLFDAASSDDAGNARREADDPSGSCTDGFSLLPRYEKTSSGQLFKAISVQILRALEGSTPSAVNTRRIHPDL
jgi:hypothetical protein